MQEKSLIKKRILQYLETKGITKYDFYKKTGITRGILDQNNGINEDNIYKFLAYAKDISPNWLITGLGSMIVNSYNFDMVAEPIAVFNEKDRHIESQRVPLYRIEAIAGAVPVFESLQTQTPLGYITIPNLPKCDGAIYMTGDSMYPLLKAGDILLYKVLNNIKNIFWGEMYILSMLFDSDTYITVKYVQRAETPNNIRLVSENRHHQEKEMPIESVKTAAHVVASIRINSIY